MNMIVKGETNSNLSFKMIYNIEVTSLRAIGQ